MVMADTEVSRRLKLLRCLIIEHGDEKFLVKNNERTLDVILKMKLENLRKCEPAEYADLHKVVSDFIMKDFEIVQCSQGNSEQDNQNEKQLTEKVDAYTQDFRKLFTIACLQILIQIHEAVTKTLSVLDESNHNNAPLIVLGANDKKLIMTACQLVVCFGVYANLKPGVCPPSSERSQYWVLLEEGQENDTVDEAFLLICIKGMCQLIRNAEFGQLIISKSLVEIFGALIQIGFKVKPQSQQDPSFKRKDIADKKGLKSFLNVCKHQRDWCKSMLRDLLDSVYQPLAVRNLLILQGFRKSHHPNPNSPSTPKWLQKICSKLLSQKLMEENGLQVMLHALFDEDNIDEKATRLIDSIGYLVSSCPYQACSLEEYYRKMSSQLLQLIDMEGIDEKLNALYSQVAVSCMSWMLKKDAQLATKFIFMPIMRPLYKISQRDEEMLREEVVVSENELTAAIRKIHKNLAYSKGSEKSFVEIVSDVSQPLFEFYCFLTNRISYLRSQLEEILIWLLRHSEAMAANEMMFLFLLGEMSQSALKQKKITMNPALKFSLGSSGCPFVESTPSASADYFQFSDTCTTEQRIVSLLALLNCFKVSTLAGSFFAFLLEKLSCLLRRKESSIQNNGNEMSDIDGIISDLKYRIPLVSMIASICDKFGDSVLQNPKHITSFIKTCMACCLASGCASDFAEIDHQTGFKNETLEMAIMILSLIVNIAKEKGEENFRELEEFVDVLYEVERSSATEPIRQMANGLRVSIMTRGAVDSRHHKQHHQSKLQHDEYPRHSACEPGRITEDYDVAMKELSDPLLPTRGHAILHLSSLLERGDVKTLGNAEELLPVFLDNLSHEDTFIYLASVRAIASLSKSQHSIVIPHLAKEFAMFPDKCNEKFKNEQFANGGSKARFRYSPENRLKIGEALMKAMVSCGPIIAVYSQQVLASLLTGVKDDDNDVRASSLSNAGDLCKLLRFAVHPVIHELMNCISSVLRFEKDVKVRRAAVRVLKLLLDGSGKDIFQVIGSVLHDIYRTLKTVVQTEADEVALDFANKALVQLGSIINKLLFPAECLKKQIRVLRP